MNLMNSEQKKMQRMLQYVGWNSSVLSLMILSNESLNDIQVSGVSKMVVLLIFVTLKL